MLQCGDERQTIRLCICMCHSTWVCGTLDPDGVYIHCVSKESLGYISHFCFRSSVRSIRILVHCCNIVLRLLSLFSLLTSNDRWRRCPRSVTGCARRHRSIVRRRNLFEIVGRNVRSATKSAAERRQRPRLDRSRGGSSEVAHCGWCRQMSMLCLTILCPDVWHQHGQSRGVNSAWWRGCSGTLTGSVLSRRLALELTRHRWPSL